MSTFTKGPENANDGKYFRSNGTPSQPQLPHITYSRSGYAIDVSLLRMPHSPEDKPPLTKYRRVEISPDSSVQMRPQLLYSDVVRVGVQNSSDSHMNGQPIPGGSSAQEPGPTISRLNEPKPQLSSNVIVIVNDTTIFNLSRLPRSPEVGPPRAKYRRVEISPDSSVQMRPQLPYSDAVRVGVQDSPDSHLIASSPINFSVNHIQGNSTPGHSTSQEENLPPQQLQNSSSCMSKKYFFERLGFSMSDFLKDSFVDKLKQKFARQHEEYDKMRNKLLKIIEKARSARKAHEREMLEKISYYQIAKCPIYLGDSVEE